MIIIVENWQLPPNLGAIAFEGDNLTARLVFEVDTDAAWSYKLDVAHPSGKNVIDLQRDGDTVYVDLTADMLAAAGLYGVQLRGTSSDKVRHTNTAGLYVASSINAIDSFPPLEPSELAQLERRMQDAVDASEAAAAKAAQVGDFLDGGAAGQVLTKKSDADKDVEWRDPTGGGGGGSGTSAYASVEQTADGAVIKCSDATGETEAIVKNGVDGYTPIKGVDYVDGKPGKDGYTPIKGVDYSDGKNGTDGTSAFASVSHTVDGAIITCRDKNGETTAEIKNGVDGTNGHTPIKGIDYFDGEPGKKGDPGEPGYTPIKGVDYFDGDPGGKGDPGDPGEPGYSPVRGTDYWTDADIATIKSYVDDAILGGAW